MPKARIGSDLARRDHGTWQTLSDLETCDTAAVRRPQLHAQHSRRSLRRGVPERPGACRKARARDIRRDQPWISVPTSSDYRVDEPALAPVATATDPGADGTG